MSWAVQVGPFPQVAGQGAPAPGLFNKAICVAQDFLTTIVIKIATVRQTLSIISRLVYQQSAQQALTN